MSISKMLPTIGLVGVMALIVTPVAVALLKMGPAQGSTVQPQTKPKPAAKPAKLAGFDGDRAYEYLAEQCKLGPRISGSDANRALRDRMVAHFESVGAQVKRQRFEGPHPVSAAAVEMENIVASWHPERNRRVVIGAHFDTRPHPDRETNPRKKTATFLGANDGASGVAVLMELGNMLGDLKTTLGVDLVAFDGEELIYDDKGDYFLGSRYFAEEYRRAGGQSRYVAGFVLDMVGGDPIAIYPDSEGYRQNPQLVEEIWDVAGRLKATAFKSFKSNRKFYDVSDDHLSLLDVGIPAIDIIDFSYKHWHLASDTADKCSAASLAQTGGVLAEWLRGK
jgi:glutaminyl-peptide cyclotransferase